MKNYLEKQKKEKEELEKANFLVIQEYNKIKNEKGVEIEVLQQKLIEQSKELETRKKHDW